MITLIRNKEQFHSSFRSWCLTNSALLTRQCFTTFTMRSIWVIDRGYRDKIRKRMALIAL